MASCPAPLGMSAAAGQGSGPVSAFPAPARSDALGRRWRAWPPGGVLQAAALAMRCSWAITSRPGRRAGSLLGRASPARTGSARHHVDGALGTCSWPTVPTESPSARARSSTYSSSSATATAIVGGGPWGGAGVAGHAHHLALVAHAGVDGCDHAQGQVARAAPAPARCALRQSPGSRPGRAQPRRCRLHPARPGPAWRRRTPWASVCSSQAL